VTHFHGLADLSVKRLATRILEHQHRPTAVTLQVDRSQSPQIIQLAPKIEFMGKVIKD